MADWLTVPLLACGRRPFAAADGPRASLDLALWRLLDPRRRSDPDLDPERTRMGEVLQGSARERRFRCRSPVLQQCRAGQQPRPDRRSRSGGLRAARSGRAGRNPRRRRERGAATRRGISIAIPAPGNGPHINQFKECMINIGSRLCLLVAGVTLAAGSAFAQAWRGDQSSGPGPGVRSERMEAPIRALRRSLLRS